MATSDYDTPWWKSRIAKYGSVEEVRKVYQEIGRKGGKVKNPNKGFAANRDRAKEAAKKGLRERYGS